MSLDQILYNRTYFFIGEAKSQAIIIIMADSRCDKEAIEKEV
jgi:hypothetical protein